MFEDLFVGFALLCFVGCFWWDKLVALTLWGWQLAIWHLWSP